MKKTSSKDHSPSITPTQGWQSPWTPPLCHWCLLFDTSPSLECTSHGNLEPVTHREHAPWRGEASQF